MWKSAFVGVYQLWLLMFAGPKYGTCTYHVTLLSPSILWWLQIFLKNIWIPVADLCLWLPFCFTLCERRYQEWYLLFQWPVAINNFNPLFYKVVGRGSSVSTATGYGLDGPGIESRRGRDFPDMSRPVLGPTQPPIQRVTGLFPRGKAAGAWR